LKAWVRGNEWRTWLLTFFQAIKKHSKSQQDT